MTKEKREKVLLSIVALAVATLVLFLSIAIYQGVRIGARKKELNRLEKEIKTLQREQEECEGKIEYWLNDEVIKEKALQLGLIKKS